MSTALLNGFFESWKNPLHRLVGIIALAFLIQIIISYGLWEPSQRLFPMVPVFDNLALNFGASFNYALFGIAVCSLLAMIFLPKKEWSILLFWLVFLCWVLQDVLRIQAWAYQYTIILGLIFFGLRKLSNQLVVLALIRWVFILTYFWTGLHKINLHFAETVFPWLMGIYAVTKPFADIQLLAFVVAVFESLIGLGLIWQKTRRISLWGLSLFHVLILILLISDNWNYVVYPWNLAMILLLWELFGKPFEWPKWQGLEKQMLVYLVAFLFGIAPGLYRLGYWPYSISLTMYSGCSLEMDFLFNYSAIRSHDLWHCMPKSLLYEMGAHSEEVASLNIDDWALNQLHVPTYASEWYYRKLGEALCPCLIKHDGAIELEFKNYWSLDSKKIVIPCATL